MKPTFEILFENSEIVAINKPAGFHVHRPEIHGELVPENKIILQNLRDQLGKSLFPLHRLDVGTTGVLVFAKSSMAAKEWNVLLRSESNLKKYEGIVRGFPADSGEVVIPLKSDSSEELLPAKTIFRTLARIAIPIASHPRFPTSRFSWLEFEIKTGRFHQIRRHMNRISHPLLGDSEHGDSRQNRFFREKLGVAGLCLHAFQLSLPQVNIEIHAPRPKKWQRIEEIFRLQSAESQE